MISEYNSKKIRFFSSFLILMVVYLHGFYLEGEQFPITNFFMKFLLFGICGVANYMFFIISGFLFFRSITSLYDIDKKIKKRIKSLFVPYMIWNLIFVLFFLIMSFIPSLSDRFVNSSIVSNLENSSFFECMYILFIKPAAFQLWYLRDLMAMVIISPIIWQLLKRTGWILPLVMLVGGAFSSQIGYVAMFVIGGYISVFKINIDNLSCKCHKLLPYIGSIYIAAAILYSFETSYTYTNHFCVFTFLCGIVSLWCLYDKLNISKIEWYNSYLGYSFFVYCSHMPFYNVIKKINLLVFGVSPWSILFLLLVNPIIAVIIIINIAKLLQKNCPKIYNILTGYRN